MISENAKQVEINHQFKTKNSILKNGIIEINFNELTFISRKRRIICKLAEEFSIPWENLWSWDGFNCN